MKNLKALVKAVSKDATDKATLDTLMTTTDFPDQDLVKGLISVREIKSYIGTP